MNRELEAGIEKIVSGGQTGVDRAALDAALAAGVPCGGWCPRGRKAEDGAIPARYPLREAESAGYSERTRRNVRDADGTLVIARAEPKGGTALTLEVAAGYGKPSLTAHPDEPGEVDRVRRWLAKNRIGVLNIAGARESESPGIYVAARRFVAMVLEGPTPGQG